MTNHSPDKINIALARSTSQDQLELIILPTEKCNFRCTYCYEDFAIGRMRPQVQRSLMLFISKSVPRLKHLSLSWFGGEPLLARDIVLQVSAHAQREAKAAGLTSFGGSLTTNASLLTKDIFEKLLAVD